MTIAEFQKKWAKFHGKESSAYQEHFNDLCRILDVPTPLDADPSGSDFFFFQKKVLKDAELFEFDKSEIATPGERGFADVWKKGCFAWEYKGKKKNLEDAYKQLLRYRESLLNPPILIVCDFDRYVVRTNFNGTVQETFEFTNAQIDRPENLRVLRHAFTDPDFLKPQRTTAEVTEKLAARIAEVAKSLQKRESVELEDARSRKEVNIAQRRNLRIARFLNRMVFCFFAEDAGLLPKNIFTEVLKTAFDDSAAFSAALQNLFQMMSKGGMFGHHKIKHFNGHLFEEATVFELNEDELKILGEASQADWQYIQPSIMGTLFERALEPEQRSQLGAHYTSEEDIKTLVEPVLMAPLRREWSTLKGELAASFENGKSAKGDKEKLLEFQKKVSTITVLDPACGSGNFLYVALQMLLDLEKEVITFATQLGLALKPKVSVQQLKAIEINPYAYELAQVSVQIGFLQWRRDNGFDNDKEPVLQNLDGFENKDALLHETFKKKPKNLKAARKEQHDPQDELFKVYVERAWPECDVIVSNPPFLGDKLMRRELGDQYVDELRDIYGNRIPGQSDLCCYWFEKARGAIEERKCNRAGLLATQGIRGGANREVLKRIKSSGDIFFAQSDRTWILSGASVHVSMVGFDGGFDRERSLDGKSVSVIQPNLTSGVRTTLALPLLANKESAFIGASMHGPFDIDEITALNWICNSNPNVSGKPNSDVIRPILNAYEITKRAEQRWVIAFPPELPFDAAVKYEEPFKFVESVVRPVRERNNRKIYREKWWIHGEARPSMLQALHHSSQAIATPSVSKFRIFVFVPSAILPSDATVAFAPVDFLLFGILQSKFHQVWALSQGTQLREKESGFRYTPTSCFETFPLPVNDQSIDSSVFELGEQLNDLRKRWLDPPEWTYEQILEFPGSISGPWARFVEHPDQQGIGNVRYKRMVPRNSECTAKLKKRTLTNLYNERPAWLILAHRKLDEAVAAAYGWPPDLSDAQILERLLALNLERAAEEKKAPLEKSTRSRNKSEDEML